MARAAAKTSGNRQISGPNRKIVPYLQCQSVLIINRQDPNRDLDEMVWKAVADGERKYRFEVKKPNAIAEKGMERSSFIIGTENDLKAMGR